MIHHLTGKLIEKQPTHVVVECAGVGYFLNISLNTFSAIPDQENLRILTYLQVREDAHILFGFYSISAQSEKLPFQALDVFNLEWATDPQISPDVLNKRRADSLTRICC